MNKQIHILLIDDDRSLCRVLEHQLTEEGFKVTITNSGKQGLTLFGKERFDCVVTDLAMPDIDGMEVLRKIRSKDTEVIVILISAYGTIEGAVEACHIGADDYITKPFGIEQLRFVIEKALRFRQLERENVALRVQLETKYGIEGLAGQSVVMQELYRLIQKVAPTDTTVLIQGESGTGKELVAKAIHALSHRKAQPFVPVDCAAIPETLLESELFGHVKGSFTGATKDRKGKFEAAEGGTLFLDEIGDMKEEMQAKLLRSLQEKQIIKVGSDRPVPVNVRIIAATNQDLAQAVQESKFRQDLFYRLSVVVITVPSLRERREDIRLLVDHFIQKYGHGRKIVLEKEGYQKLMAREWPGNVRELENAVERALVLAEGDTIFAKDLPDNFLITSQSVSVPEDKTLAEIEKHAIIEALRKAHGNRSEAARLLGIPRHVLLYRIKKWGIKD
jgi:DNA-binding NtrC family response regulator